MKVNYAEETTLKVGIPYTYGTGASWYVLTGKGDILYLNEPVGIELVSKDTAEWHRRSVQAQPGFRYAKSMGIL